MSSLLQKSPPVDDVGLALTQALTELVAAARPHLRIRLVLVLRSLALGAEGLDDLSRLLDLTAVRAGVSAVGAELAPLLFDCSDLVREAADLSVGALEVVYDAERVLAGLEPLVTHVPWRGPYERKVNSK